MGFIVVVGLAIPCAIHAQKVEITPFAGRQFGGKLGTRTGELKIPAAWNYGLILDIATGPGTQLEVLYARQETSLVQRVDSTASFSRPTPPSRVALRPATSTPTATLISSSYLRARETICCI